MLPHPAVAATTQPPAQPTPPPSGSIKPRLIGRPTAICLHALSPFLAQDAASIAAAHLQKDNMQESCSGTRQVSPLGGAGEVGQSQPPSPNNNLHPLKQDRDQEELVRPFVVNSVTPPLCSRPLSGGRRGRYERVQTRRSTKKPTQNLSDVAAVFLGAL